jgi:hypothetical protein
MSVQRKCLIGALFVAVTIMAREEPAFAFCTNAEYSAQVTDAWNAAVAECMDGDPDSDVVNFVADFYTSGPNEDAWRMRGTMAVQPDPARAEWETGAAAA